MGKNLNVPFGFIRFTGPRGYALHAQPWATSPLTGKTTSFSALFTKSQHFFYVQQRVHMNGMLTGLKKGTFARAGKCTVWTGRFPDGIRWLSFQKGHIALLATTDNLSIAALKKWAGTVPGCVARSRAGRA